ncbi:MAG: SDR family NAD(P)-dependent oxidoreductase [Hyphomicrobiales bacterium]
MDLQLKGKRALVTGGTRGIGRAIAFGFADEGADVAVCARDALAVARMVAALKGRGVNAFGRPVDVADGAALAEFVHDAAAAFGGLDCAVANASALASGADEAAFRQAFEVDMMHTRNLAEAAMPYLEKSGTGSFTAIASVSGSEDYGFEDAAYGSMKSALLFYVKSMARYVAAKGVRANVVSPGMTYFKDGFWHKVEETAPDDFAAAVAASPMGRLAKPEEIANAVVFLSSAAAGFVSGVNFVVDGTLTRRIQN